MKDDLSAPQIANKSECPRCRGILNDTSSVTLEDGRSYCGSCIEEVGLSEFAAANQSIREDYRIGLAKGLWLGLYTGFVLTTVIAAGLFAMFLMLNVAFMMGGLKPNAAQPGELTRILRVFAFFFMVSYVFVGVIGFPMGLFGTLFALRRTIQVSDGQISYDAGLRHVVLPLSDCHWQISSTCIDAYTIVSLRRPSIIVKSSKGFIVCGFTPDSLRLWKGYLLLAVGPATPKHNWLKHWKVAVFHVVFATTLGWLIGRLLQSITGHPMWPSAVMFLGTLDGLINSVLVLLRGHPRTKNAAVINPWICSLTFAAIGGKVGVAAGLPGLIGCMIGNGVLGWLFGRAVQQQVVHDAANQIDEERGEITTQEPLNK